MGMAMLQGELFARCQRWRDRNASYRPAGEVFNPNLAQVQLIGESDAKSFVCRHHYSGTYPAARCRVGLFVKRPFQTERLAGVAVFSVPMNNAAVPAWFQGLSASEGVELGRFVLLDEVEANAETWFQARALRAVAAQLPEVRAVLSYCDPIARTDEAGVKVFPGHLGTKRSRTTPHACPARGRPSLTSSGPPRTQRRRKSLHLGGLRGRCARLLQVHPLAASQCCRPSCRPFNHPRSRPLIGRTRRSHASKHSASGRQGKSRAGSGAPCANP